MNLLEDSFRENRIIIRVVFSFREKTIQVISCKSWLLSGVSCLECWWVELSQKYKDEELLNNLKPIDA